MNFTNVVKCLMAIMFYPWMRICQKGACGVILYYHGVPSKYAEVFRKQIFYLAKRYEIVAPTSISCTDKGGRKRIIAITFDDAFENVFEIAVPILKQYQLRAAICVPTGYIGKTAGWSMSSECDCKDKVVMTQEQISLLDQQGFEVYSHTVSHCPLATQDMKVIQYELEQSKAVLEDIVGHDVISISYPHGSINQSVFHLCKKVGYRYGFTIEPSEIRLESDPLQYGRVSVSLADPMFVFRLKAAGAFQVEVYLRRWKKALCKTLNRIRHLYVV